MTSTDAELKQAVKQRVVQLLVDNFSLPAAKITDDASFKKTLGMDSLDIVDFVFFVQKSFGFKAELDEYRELHTVALLVDFLVKKTGGKLS